MSEKNPSPRQSIDQIDARIVELLDQRATLALEAGQAKAAAGEGAYAPPREAAILSQVDQTPAGAFPRNSLKAVFGEIISACRHLQTQDHIVVLGEKFGWVHDAALAQFGSSAGFDAVEGGDEVVEAIRKDPSIL
ncbi:MAG: chorismate mutase, partial [Candidatus Riflebacteria bacterium]|nr:chorismate mutase [Candidatus Riflebacteria bacterium]